MPITTSTSTTVPLLTEISCEPGSNPFNHNPMMSQSEYSGGYYPNITITRVCTFAGQVVRGQIYKHQILKDLVFCLVPSEGAVGLPNDGWEIVISDSFPGGCDFKSDSFVNFGPIVTPPFHGNMDFDVYGWHFRNQGNTGANAGSINAPQNDRFFNFVFNRKDYITEWYALRCASWGIDTDCALATQTSSNQEPPRSRAEFTITKLELGNLIPGSYAWIEYMEFEVKIYLAAK
jgi:hypothetical protein